MKWTKQRPTKPGWYWAKDGPGIIPQVVSVEGPGRLGVLCINDENSYTVGDFKWWSDEPIKEPEDRRCPSGR